MAHERDRYSFNMIVDYCIDWLIIADEVYYNLMVHDFPVASRLSQIMFTVKDSSLESMRTMATTLVLDILASLDI